MRRRATHRDRLVGFLAVGCGDATPVVTPTPRPSLDSGVATPAPTAPAPTSAGGPTTSPSGGAAQATPSPTPTTASDWTALRWSQPVTISATALPADILFWQGAYVAVGSDGTGGTDGTVAAAWTSPDFATWTPASLDGLPLKDAAIGWPVARPGGGLVSLGGHGRIRCGTGAGATCDPRPVAIWTSADGRWPAPAGPRPRSSRARRSRRSRRGPMASWPSATPAGPPGDLVLSGRHELTKEALPAGVFRHAEFSGLTAYRDRWVLTGLTDPVKPACCTGSDSKELKAAAWFSEDGRSWSRASVEPAAEETIFLPFAGSDGLAAGRIGWTWLSADGSSWRPDRARRVNQDRDRSANPFFDVRLIRSGPVKRSRMPSRSPRRFGWQASIPGTRVATAKHGRDFDPKGFIPKRHQPP